MIRGLGVDLVSVKRLEAAVARQGEKFLMRVFTPQEIEYCRRKRFPIPHLAGRWAIKEAFFKAMGIGWGEGLRWQEVELEGRNGLPPRVILNGGTKKRAEEMGISEVWASVSHEKEFAVAMVLLADKGGGDDSSGKGVISQ